MLWGLSMLDKTTVPETRLRLSIIKHLVQLINPSQRPELRLEIIYHSPWRERVRTICTDALAEMNVMVDQRFLLTSIRKVGFLEQN